MFEEMRIRYFVIMTIIFSISLYWITSTYNIPSELVPEFEIIAVLFLSYYFFRHKRSMHEFINDKEIYRKVPSYLLLALIFHIFTISVFWLQLYLQNYNNPFTFIYEPIVVGTLYLVIQMIMSTVTGPIAEEFIFRGFLLNRLIKKTNIWIGILISSAAFAAFHLDYKILISTFLFGIIASLLYLRTRNLLVPILIHMFHNSIVFIQSSLVPPMNMSFSVFSYMDNQTFIWLKFTTLTISFGLIIMVIVYLAKGGITVPLEKDEEDIQVKI